MKKALQLIIVSIIGIFLVSCGKEDYEISNDIFEEYKKALDDAGYTINKITDSNNISRWLEISKEDFVSLHRADSEEKDGVMYIYLFPTIKKTNKWFEKFIEHTEVTNYSVYMDGHYLIVVLGDELTEIAKNISG
jgi:hypothetical protein